MIIYVDLDGTLIHAQEDPRTGQVGPIQVRPGAPTFLYRMAQVGDVVLLTHATRGHAIRALEAIGPASQVFQAVLSREDLAPVIDQLEAIDSEPGLQERDRRQLYREILPIAPPGFMVDDWPVGSWMYWLKSRAIGIGPDRWIQVPPYDPGRTNGTALKRAYYEVLERVQKVA